MAPTVEQFIAECSRDIGYIEAPTNRTKFAAEAGLPDGQAWCETYLNAKAKTTGLAIPAGVAHTAYTPTAASLWTAAGRSGHVPKRGAWAYIDFPGDGVNRISHVALVTDVLTNGYVRTIEGNTSPTAAGSQRDGGGVRAKQRLTSIVKLYAYPDYALATPGHAPTPTQRTLKVGMIGLDVAFWQGLLHLKADGVFGPVTKAATAAFQAKAHLEADGVVGPATWKYAHDLMVFLGAGL